MSLLVLDNVDASYGAVRALKGISLRVEEGAIVTLLGANGAGKSTTLKAISGMVKANEGSIQFAGQPLAGKTPNQIVRLGIVQVPEGRKIFRDLTVAENLWMGAYVRRDKAAVERDREMVFDLFAILRERRTQLGGSLSGGEQQMLAIGRGLMARPKLLLLDEPSLGLAPRIVRDIFDTLEHINKEHRTTLVIVEQNVHIALKYSDYGYVLQVGKVAIEGASAELRQNQGVVETYMGIQG